MTKSVQEILARMEARRREEEEDKKLLSDSYKEAASEIKSQLDDLAGIVGKHPLDLLDYDTEQVKEWLASKKPPLFESEDEALAWKLYKGANEDKWFSDGKDKYQVKIKGSPNAKLVAAWRAGTLVPVKEEKK